MKERIILASGSKTRKKILEKLGLTFEMIPSNFKEDMTLKFPPEKLAMEIALGKAEDVSKKLKDGIVIGIDTFVYFDNETIGKPKDKDDAKKMLNNFSGKKHLVYSGIAIINCKDKSKIVDFEKTVVKFRELEDKEINDYIESGEPLDKAGAYGIQGKGGLLVKKIEGCYYNVEGFPVSKIIEGLKKLGTSYS